MSGAGLHSSSSLFHKSHTAAAANPQCTYNDTHTHTSYIGIFGESHSWLRPPQRDLEEDGQAGSVSEEAETRRQPLTSDNEPRVKQLSSN